jgi:3-deoxy-7-phosphoheptulonate synthase / chorismate mutase
MASSNDIQQLRDQLNATNLQLLDLISERARLAAQLAQIESRSGSDLYDPEHEAEQLTQLQLANEGPFNNEIIKALFKEIFKATLAVNEQNARSNLFVMRQTADERTVIDMGDAGHIGAGDFQVIAGPCAIESYMQYEEVAAALVEEGITIMRAMAFKPRTSPYDFQGMGENGLKMARQIANKYQLKLVSEVLDMSQIPMMSDYVDMFWVGARNMQNAFLLRAIGKTNKPVVLKRHFGANIREFLYAAEYIMSEGNREVILMERGIRTYETATRNTLDISAVPVLKLETHLPVIVDISHSAGRRDIANTLARVAKASGADGLMVEVHPNPPVAMSDAKQQLSIAQFKAMMRDVRRTVIQPEPEEETQLT